MCTGTDGSGSCDNAKVVGNSTQEMDIASVDIMAVVSEYGSPAILEVGTTYTHMKTTMSRTIQMTGTADDGGVTCNTAAVTDDNYPGTEADQKYSHIPVINNGQTMALTEVRMQNESVTKCLNDDCSSTETDSSWMSYGAKDEGALYAIHNAPIIPALFTVTLFWENCLGSFISIEGMGLGDAKLLAAIGFWFGWHSIPYVIFLSSLSALLIALPSLINKSKSMSSQIPFGPYLIFGTVTYLVVRNYLTFI